MFGLFKKISKRVIIDGSNIFIDNRERNVGIPSEVNWVFKFSESIPEIKIYENSNLLRAYRIDTLNENPNLHGQFLHSSIRIQSNSAVMIDGIISDNELMHLTWEDENYEAIRFQPFFLSDSDIHNLQLVGKGLFDRGLHYAGTITPRGVRCICICDNCRESFTIQHTHAGFSNAQYFYSSENSKTLLVPYEAVSGMPTQLQQDINENILDKVEAELSKSLNVSGKFKYYNPFRCTYCMAPFIDFERYREIRPKEYYANTYINQNATWL